VKKRANKVRGLAAEPVERRASAARNLGIHAKAGTQRLAELDTTTLDTHFSQSLGLRKAWGEAWDHDDTGHPLFAKPGTSQSLGRSLGQPLKRSARSLGPKPGIAYALTPRRP